jgi:hypothetical protein
MSVTPRAIVFLIVAAELPPARIAVPPGLTAVTPRSVDVRPPPVPETFTARPAPERTYATLLRSTVPPVDPIRLTAFAPESASATTRFAFTAFRLSAYCPLTLEDTYTFSSVPPEGIDRVGAAALPSRRTGPPAPA